MGDYEEAAAGERRERRYDFKRAAAAAAAACESPRLLSAAGSELGDRRLRFTNGSDLTAVAAA